MNYTGTGGITINGDFARSGDGRITAAEWDGLRLREGTGFTAIGGSATVEWFFFKLRETVYRRDKAIQGTLEKITVKKRFYNNGFLAKRTYIPGDGFCAEEINRPEDGICTVYTRLPYKGVAIVQCYKDTFNTIYIQEELVRYDEAISLGS